MDASHRPSQEEIAPTLGALSAALRSNDMQALELFDSLAARHGQSPTREWQALQVAMDNFDTEEALHIVEKLLSPTHACPSA